MSDITKRVVNGFQLSDGSAATLIDDSSVNRNNTWSSEEIINRIFPNITEKGTFVSTDNLVADFPVQLSRAENDAEIYKIGRNFLGHNDGMINTDYKFGDVNVAEGRYIFDFNYSSFGGDFKYGNTAVSLLKHVDANKAISPIVPTIPAGRYRFSFQIVDVSIINTTTGITEEDFKTLLEQLFFLTIVHGGQTSALSNGAEITLQEASSSFNLGFNHNKSFEAFTLPMVFSFTAIICLERDPEISAQFCEPCKYEVFNLNESAPSIQVNLYPEGTYFLSDVEFSCSGKKDLIKSIQNLENAVLSLGGNA